MSNVRLREVAAGNIRAEAARLGMTQTQIAHRLGLDSSSISRRWWGRQPWTLDLIEDVADVLRVNYLELLRARRDSNPQPSDPEEDTQEALPGIDQDDTAEDSPHLHQRAA